MVHILAAKQKSFTPTLGKRLNSLIVVVVSDISVTKKSFQSKQGII